MLRAAVALTPGLQDLASTSDDEYLQYANDLWTGWNDLPASFRWLHQSSETLELRLAGQAQEASALIAVQAILDDFHAYAYMQACKIREALAGLVDQLNQGNMVSAASAGRTAIEANVALGVMTFRAHRHIPQRGDSIARALEDMAEFSDQITASIWGGRSAKRPIGSINILTLLKALLKASTDPSTNTNLERIYSELCDVVHPSALGHQLFWCNPVAEEDKGPWVVELAHGVQANAVSGDVVMNLLWVLGWASYRARSLWSMATTLVEDRAESLRQAGILPSDE